MFSNFDNMMYFDIYKSQLFTNTTEVTVTDNLNVIMLPALDAYTAEDGAAVIQYCLHRIFGQEPGAGPVVASQKESQLTRSLNFPLVTIDTVDIGGSWVRSYYSAASVTDVALYTEPEEIYLMKKNGDVVLYDATNMTEVILT